MLVDCVGKAFEEDRLAANTKIDYAKLIMKMGDKASDGASSPRSRETSALPVVQSSERHLEGSSKHEFAKEIKDQLDRYERECYGQEESLNTGDIPSSLSVSKLQPEKNSMASSER